MEVSRAQFFARPLTAVNFSLARTQINLTAGNASRALGHCTSRWTCRWLERQRRRGTGRRPDAWLIYLALLAGVHRLSIPSTGAMASHLGPALAGSARSCL